MAQVARALVAGSKGLLPMDENDGERATGGSRRAGGPQTGEARRACRELITFLSGGQSGELASSRLNVMNLLVGSAKSRLPRALTFSLARAIQHPALDIWNAGTPMSRQRSRPCCTAPNATGRHCVASVLLPWNRHDSSALSYPARRNGVVAVRSAHRSDGPALDRARRRRSSQARAMAQTYPVCPRPHQPTATRSADLRTGWSRGDGGGRTGFGRVELRRL
jgi:Fructose-bisphosphate aldolase class-I